MCAPTYCLPVESVESIVSFRPGASGVVFRCSGLVAYLPVRYLAGLPMFSLCWDWTQQMIIAPHSKKTEKNKTQNLWLQREKHLASVNLYQGNDLLPKIFSLTQFNLLRLCWNVKSVKILSVYSVSFVWSWWVCRRDWRSEDSLSVLSFYSVDSRHQTAICQLQVCYLIYFLIFETKSHVSLASLVV